MCYEEMLKEGYRCPLCMHCAVDVTGYWRHVNDEDTQAPMPSECQHVTADTVCSDCSGRSTVQFHTSGVKCNACESSDAAQAGGSRISLDQQRPACGALENSVFLTVKAIFSVRLASCVQIYASELMGFALVSQHKVILQILEDSGSLYRIVIALYLMKASEFVV